MQGRNSCQRRFHGETGKKWDWIRTETAKDQPARRCLSNFITASEKKRMFTVRGGWPGSSPRRQIRENSDGNCSIPILTTSATMLAPTACLRSKPGQQSSDFTIGRSSPDGPTATLGTGLGSERDPAVFPLVPRRIRSASWIAAPRPRDRARSAPLSPCRRGPEPFVPRKPRSCRSGRCR
jgi:hypothetical protein